MELLQITTTQNIFETIMSSVTGIAGLYIAFMASKVKNYSKRQEKIEGNLTFAVASIARNKDFMEQGFQNLENKISSLTELTRPLVNRNNIEDIVREIKEHSYEYIGDDLELSEIVHYLGNLSIEFTTYVLNKGINSEVDCKELRAKYELMVLAIRVPISNTSTPETVNASVIIR